MQGLYGPVYGTWKLLTFPAGVKEISALIPAVKEREEEGGKVYAVWHHDRSL